MNYNAYGNLDGGIIKGKSLADVQRSLVDDFPDSTTRQRNFDGLKQLFSSYDSITIEGFNFSQLIDKFWIDGSFTTLKVDPNDIDLVFFLNGEPDKINITQQVAQNPQQFHSFGEHLHCDTYFIINKDTIPEQYVNERSHFDMLKKYWMGQFGFDRNENPKGLLEIEMPINKVV